MFNHLTKKQLIELLTLIKNDVDYIQKCAVEEKDNYEKTNDVIDLVRSTGYEQSARWINEQFAKYTESTRP